MLAQHLPSFRFQRERWRNGAGWTRAIVSEPPGEPDFGWRASIAEIDQDCAFSAFPGYDRELVLVAGEGGRLLFGDGRSIELSPPRGRVAFAGEDAPRCEIAGRLQVFNLMVDRARHSAELLHRPLVGPMVFFPEPAVRWLVLLLSGRARLPDTPNSLLLEHGDALLLTPEPESPKRLVLTGGGEVLLARIADRVR
jgi:environmental stress-induced protein Ves